MINYLENVPLQFVTLRVAIEADQQLQLGKYPAMTIRGGLGYALRDTACTCREGHEQTCIYAKLYEEHEGTTSEGEYIPYSRPIIIRTGENTKYTYKQHEPYTFELTLFGDAITYVPELLIALKHFGTKGIGDKKDVFFIQSVETVHPTFPQLIYAQHTMLQRPTPLTLQHVLRHATEENARVCLQFTEPLRLQIQGARQFSVPIDVLTENIVRRLNSLLYFHHNEQTMTDAGTFIEEAFNAEVEAEQFHYVKYKRFSTRQKQQGYIDGIKGELTVRNVSPALQALLTIGQYVHVGKQTIFGFGAYRLLHLPK